MDNGDDDTNLNYSSSEEGKKLNNQNRKLYQSRYSVSWEQDSRFKSFLSKSKKGCHFFFCSFCLSDVSIKSRGIADIIRHQQAKKHQKVAIERKCNPSLTTMPVVQEANNLERQVKAATIRYSAFTAEHNLPFSISDHASLLFTNMFPDSKIAKVYKSKRTKTTAIIENVIGRESEESLLNILRNNKFCIIIDESTDRQCIKHLCIIARYFNEQLFEVKDQFLTLIPLEKFDHRSVFNKITDFFRASNIPYCNNLIGFAADGASVNFGCDNSISTLFKAEIPNIFSISCICHSFAIIASNACAELPRHVEDVARDVYNYLKMSSRRLHAFRECQKICAVKPHKLLHPAQTRWLSLEAVVKRLLEQFDSLIMYFSNAVNEEKLHSTANILQWLRDPQTKIFLQFLDYVLPLFNRLNRLFQSETTLVYCIYDQVLSLYKEILACYMKPKYVDKAETVNPSNPDTFVRTEDVYIGVVASASLTDTDPKMRSFIKTRCLNFYVKAASEIRRKFNFVGTQESLLKHLSILQPNNILNSNSLSSLLRFYEFLPSEFLQNVDSEFRFLHTIKNQLDFSKNFVDFWKDVAKFKCGNDLRFTNLCCFLYQYIFILPHSSANVERIFSMVNNNKVKARNRLSTNALNGILHSKEYIKEKKCHSFKINESILSKFNSTTMYPNRKETEKSESDSESDSE